MIFIRRLLLLIGALFCIAFAVTLAVKAALGISPVSSNPFVLSNILPFSFGQMVMAFQFLFVIFQILLLKRNFPPVQLFQVPLAIVLGLFQDLTDALMVNFNPETMVARLVTILVSSVIIAIGISAELKAGLLVLPSDGFLAALSTRLKRPVSTIKTIQDIVFVTIATSLSLIFLGRIQGIGIGTVIFALLVGPVIGFIRSKTKLIQLMEAFIGESEDKKIEV